MNKLFTINLNTAKGSTQAIRFNIDTSQPRKPIAITAAPNVRYEIIDESTLTGPQNIIFKRNGHDLYIAFLDERVDIILEGYYSQPQNGIVGLAEDGNFYQYVPESGYNLDYVTLLPDGGASWNALGGQPTSQLYSLGSTNIVTPASPLDVAPVLAQGGPAYAGWPYYAGLLAATAGIVALSFDNNNSPDIANPTISTVIDNSGVTAQLVSGQVTHDMTPQISGNAAINTNLSIYLDGKLIGTTVSDANGHWIYELHAASGTYAITVANTTSGAPVYSQPFYLTLADSDTYNNISSNDQIIGTTANETFVVTALDYGKIDGANGIDTLTLGQGGMTLNFSSKTTTHIENIDLGQASNKLVLQLSDILSEGTSYTDHALTILGPSGATIDLDLSAWQVSGTTTDGKYQIYHPTAYGNTDKTHDLWIQNGINII